MTDTKPPRNPVFVDLCTRFDFDDARGAEYLGVPVFTFRKWLNGERTPNASALRLLEVLGMVEVLAPAIHASFLPQPKKPKKTALVKQVPSNP